MKRKFLLLLCIGVSMSGCAGHSVSDSALNNIEDSLVVLEKSLPEQCKTDSINAQFNVIRGEIVTVREGIETRLQVVTADKIKWKVAFFALMLVMVAFIAGKFII